MLEPYKAKAQAHPGGIVDLSVGTPVDPVPAVVREALARASDAPGYPATAGTRALREAAAGWLARRHQVVVDPDAVLPVIGTKELIAGLPTLLGCGPGDVVVHPELAYPTYDVGARLAGGRPVPLDDPAGLGGSSPRDGTDRGGLGGSSPRDGTDRGGLGGSFPRDGTALLPRGPEPVALWWLNSPSNPTGQVLPAEHLRKVVRWARERGTVVASDECYIELGWEQRPVSVLHPDACDGSHAGLLAVHSLSKRSSMAGYRVGFVAGDPRLIAELLEIRKHAGMMVPGPVQAAAAAALGDDDHADAQKARYAARRALLRPALEAAGWVVEHSQAGLYLWAAHPARDGWESVAALAGAGILVAPGLFYGPAGGRHVRAALTATDERIAAAVARLAVLA